MRKDASNFNRYVLTCNWFITTGFGLTLSRKARQYSRLVAYCLILTSVLALFNASVQTVSSQTFNTSTSTENSMETAQTSTTSNATQVPSTITENLQTTITATSTATQIQFSIAYATSNLVVTVFQVQYTTVDNLFTVVNVQFTTLTSSVTQVDSPQPIGAPPLPIHSSSGAPIASDALPGHIDAGLMPQLTAASLIILLASMALIRRERK